MRTYLKRDAMAAKIAAGELSGFHFCGARGFSRVAAVPTDAQMGTIKERFNDALLGRVVPFVISSANRCDDGLAIDPAGWDLEEYEACPMVLWQHNAWSRPRVADSYVFKEPEQLSALACFYTREFSQALDQSFSWAIGELAALRGYRASVGFAVVEARLADEATRKLVPWALDVEVARLDEWSIANLGMDVEAISAGRVAGVDVEPIGVFAERLLDEGGLRDVIRAELERVRVAALPAAPIVSLPSVDAIRAMVAEAIASR